MNEQQKQALKRILGYVNPPHFVNAVHISPAQQLRNAADDIEQKERDVQILTDYLNS